MSVALDTMVLIWGGLRGDVLVGEDTDANAREKRTKSVLLLRQLDARKETIIIPSIVVAELLCPLEPHEHGKFVAALTQRFFCPSFDIHAATIAAELFRYNKSLPVADQIRRQTLKSDIMIVATAKAAGASVFYSNDSKCRKLATKVRLKALDLPTHSENLFTDAEFKKGLPHKPIVGKP